MTTISSPREWRKPQLRWAATGVVLALGAPFGFFLLQTIESGTFSLHHLAAAAATYAYLTISTAVVFGLFGWMVGRQIARFQRLSHTDPLTGLPNARALEDKLNEEFARAARYRQPVSLLLIDVDNLKEINDRRGHADGDGALRAVATAIRAALREADFASRRSGDEFVVVAPGTTPVAAAALADRIRRKVRSGRHEVPVSVSVGVAGWPDESMSPVVRAGQLLAAADEALYAAKHAGRDAVSHIQMR